MKTGAIRLPAMFLLILLLVLGLIPEKSWQEEDTGIIVSRPCEENGDIDIHIREANAQRQTDGRYLVEVTFTTHAAYKLDNMRMVTVFCGEQSSTFPLTEDNLEDIHTVCITEAVQPESVRVEVRAHRTEGGLLLIADGEGQLCAEACAPVSGDRILLISGCRPEAVYEVYRVAELSDLLSGMVVLNLVPTAEELDTYAVPTRYMTSLTGNDKGAASCNFTMEGYDDGVYLIVGEKKACYVCVPQVEVSGAFRSSVVRLSFSDEQGDVA